MDDADRRFARLDGRRLPSSARAVWHRAPGPFACAELEIDPSGIEFNVEPAR